MGSVRRALAISFASGYSMLVIQFIGTIILARLLTPEQIGIYSIGAVFIGVAHIIRDFGVGQFLIQTKVLRDDHIRAAFFITISVAWLLALVLFLCSGPISEFYNQPGIQPVMQLLAVNFLLIPFGSVVRAVWQRKLDMKPIYIVTLASTAAQVGVSVLLAWRDFGFMALAIGSVVSTIVTIIVTIWLRPKDMPWMPGIRRIREVISFSGWLVGGDVVRESATAAPDLIIGKVLGAAPVGFFGKAMGTIQIFQHLVMRGIYPVLLPHLSQHIRDKGNTEWKYRQALSLLSGIAWPFFAFMAIFASQIVHVLYGDQWDQSIHLVRILTLQGFFFALLSLNMSMMVALGEVKQVMRLTLAIEPVKIALLLLMAPHGINMAATALVIGSALQWLLHVRYIYPCIGVSLPDIAHTVASSIAVTAMCGLAAGAVWYLPDFVHLSELMQLLIGLACTLIAWIIGLRVTGHPAFHEIRNVLSRLKEYLPPATP